MAKVSRKVVTPTSPFKVQLQESAASAVTELEQLLSADKTLDWDMHKEFSAVIEKVANSAIKDINKLNEVSPPPVPDPPPHTPPTQPSYLDNLSQNKPEYSGS